MKTTLTLLLLAVLFVAGCQSGLSVQDKIAIAESAVDATALEGRIAKMDPNDPATLGFVITAQSHGARALRLIDFAVNGNEWGENDPNE